VLRHGTEVFIRHVEFPAGGSTGWHTHLGPVLVNVVRGSLTLYEGDDKTCTGVTYTAGHGFIDQGFGHVHLARNEDSEPADPLLRHLHPAARCRGHPGDPGIAQPKLPRIGSLEARTVLEGRAERPALQQLRELPRFPRTQLTPPHRSGSSMMSSPLPEHRTAPVGRPVKARHPDTAAPRSRLGDDVVVTTGGPHRGAKLRDNGATGYRRHPRRPCHKRAIHSSPERSSADTHGQLRSSPTCAVPHPRRSQQRPIWLCKQVIVPTGHKTALRYPASGRGPWAPRDRKRRTALAPRTGPQ
jgi:hypothetical protein